MAVAHGVEVISRSPEETRSIGRILGARARAGDVILLVGGLGSGKTCLTQGILWGLGVDEFARSPTFVLVSQYRGRLMLYHMDLYRLDTIDEVIDLGLEEYLFGDGVCVVEWAEKAPDVFPKQHLMVRIDHVGETTRRLTLTDGDHQYSEALNAVRSATAGS